MAMYRLSSIFGWNATIFVCLPKDTSSMQNGHAYICVEDHFWGIDPSTEYKVVFRFEKDEIQWKH